MVISKFDIVDFLHAFTIILSRLENWYFHEPSVQCLFCCNRRLSDDSMVYCFEKYSWYFQSEFDSINKCPNTINPDDLGRCSKILKSSRRSCFWFFLFIEHKTKCLKPSPPFFHPIQFVSIWFRCWWFFFFMRKMIYAKWLNSEKLTPLLTRFLILFYFFSYFHFQIPVQYCKIQRKNLQ